MTDSSATNVFPLRRGADTSVLVVHEDEGCYRLVSDFLAESGRGAYRVERTAGYEAACEEIARTRHDVYLSGFRLGDHSGVELLRLAKIAGIASPFIMLGDTPSREHDEQALQAGAADYLARTELTPALLERSLRYAIERGRLVSALNAAARRDTLTGVANRRQFMEFLRGALARSRRSHSILGLLVVDLTGFKQINEAHGHGVGDQVLRAVAEALTRSVRAGDLVARLGGDEFAIVLDALQSETSAATVATKVLDAIARCDHGAPGGAVRSQARIGIALHPRDALTPSALMQAADAAMSRAKREGPDAFQYFQTVYQQDRG